MWRWTCGILEKNTGRIKLSLCMWLSSEGLSAFVSFGFFGTLFAIFLAFHSHWPWITSRLHCTQSLSERASEHHCLRGRIYWIVGVIAGTALPCIRGEKKIVNTWCASGRWAASALWIGVNSYYFIAAYVFFRMPFFSPCFPIACGRM